MAGPVNSINGLTPAQYVKITKTEPLKELFEMVQRGQSDLVNEINQLPPTVENAVNINELLPEDIKQALLKQSTVKDVSASSEALKKLMDMIRSINNNQQGSTWSDTSKLSAEVMVKPELLLDEIIKQNQTATLYKGNFFEILRNILKHNMSNSEVKNAVADVLRVYNFHFSEARDLEMMNQNISKLFQQLIELKDPSLANLIRKFLANPPSLKQLNYEPQKNNEVLLSLNQNQETASSLKYESSDKDFLPILKQILIKYPADEKIKNTVGEILLKFANLNEEADDRLSKSLNELMKKMDEAGGDFSAFKDSLEGMKGHFVNSVSIHASQVKSNEETSSFDKLISLLSSSIKDNPGNEAVKSTAEQVLRGILVTNIFKDPMLHFVIPIKYRETEAFSELWIDPNGKREGPSKTNELRLVLSLDIEKIGHFEGDITLQGKRFSSNIYYPHGLSDEFKDLKDFVKGIANDAGFWVEKINVGEIKGRRTLEEAFERPFERRMELNARA